MVDRKYNFKFGTFASLAFLTFAIIGFVHVVVKIFGG